MQTILDGKAVAAALSEKTKKVVERLKKLGKTPALAIVRVGEDAADLAYERGAIKRCENLGIGVNVEALPQDATTEQMLRLIERLNADADVDGVLILRPLPKHIDDAAVCDALAPAKDVDGVGARSMAAVFAGKGNGFAPCTAEACVAILKHYRIKLEGKNAVVVGRSLVVGRPVAMLLMQNNATVTICHTRTKKLAAVCKRADILIAAAGAPKLVSAGSFNRRQIVVDAGINVDENGDMVGDVDFAKAVDTVRAITPVPGGVGSVTTSVLAEHVVIAAAESLG